MKNKNLIWGLILIVVGVLVGFNALGITKVDVFFSGWWTLFIIIPCVIGLFNDNDKMGSIIGILVGVILLLGCQDIIDFDIIWKLILPVILVLVGISIIFKDSFTSKIKKEISKNSKGDNEEYSAIFGGQELDFTNEVFNGCELNSIFGGIKCDIRKANIKGDALIEANSIFGGITLYVPKNIRIKITSVPIFGGVSDERRERNNTSENTLYIKANCMFGGVTINDKRSKDD